MKGRKLLLVLLIVTLSFVLVISGCTQQGSSSEVKPEETKTEGSKSEEPTDDGYPEKPVTVIVGFSPGGGTDTAARLVFKYAEKYFGQSFAVVNKPGATGEIAWTELAFTKPDGYTIGFINPPTFVAHPIQREGCKYKLEDFAPIANLVSDPAVICVAKESSFNGVKDLFDEAKKSESSVSMGYSGPGSSEALILRKLEGMTSSVLNKVPFDGSAPSVVALLGGHVDAVCMNVSEAINYVNDGKVKVLGVTSPEKVKDFPDVDTFREQGFDVISVSLRGVAAPGKMKKEHIAKIEDSIKKALKDPEFIAKAEEIKLPVDFMDSEAYTKFLNEISQDLMKEWEKSPW